MRNPGHYLYTHLVAYMHHAHLYAGNPIVFLVVIEGALIALGTLLKGVERRGSRESARVEAANRETGGVDADPSSQNRHFLG